MADLVQVNENLFKLQNLLQDDLDFHDKASDYSSHALHSFPAKFPPQLPKKFIEALTDVNDIVLDPMAGSGTTIVEARLADRVGIGFDIDPLAMHIAKVKNYSLTKDIVLEIIEKTIQDARSYLDDVPVLKKELNARWDEKTKAFVDYWFAEETQLELLALIKAIGLIEDQTYKKFFELIFSSIIVAKSGGVSLAFDLAHTRPHKAKVVFSKTGEILVGHDLQNSKNKRVKLLTKSLKSAIDQFEKQVVRKTTLLFKEHFVEGRTSFNAYGNVYNLPMPSDYVDLIVTSTPYAANAIDYMRAHKFSLVWLDYSVEKLGDIRKKYIGGDATQNFEFEIMPPQVEKIIMKIGREDPKKADVLRRYYTEMIKALQEMYRVLKPGKSAILVVGNSIMRGISTETAFCLRILGENIGFSIPEIGIRNLDRNRRMMPVSIKKNGNSQIQQRMHKEYVIGFYKPEQEGNQ